jgi:signal transduction histidine kinase
MLSVLFSVAVLRHHPVQSLGFVLLWTALSLISGGALVAIRRARVREVESRYAAIMDERNRLAREFHDTLLQGFAGVTLMVAAAARDVRDPAQAAVLEHAADLAERRLREARQAVWDLRDSLDEGDLVTAMQAEADEAVKDAGLGLEFVTVGLPRPIDAEASNVMLHVAREAITNAVRHANATQLRIRLSFHRHVVQVSVRDNGTGFTVDPDVPMYGHHWGLRGMRERAAEIGAALSVHSKPGNGTEVLLAVRPRSLKLKSIA